jgi:hypothetical protein
LEAFDRPDTMASCSRRNRSTTAPQALVLLNSEFSQESAAALGETLHRVPGDVRARVRVAYQRTLGRSPSQTESEEALKLIRTGDFGLEDFCLALFNLNEFVYVD